MSFFAILCALLIEQVKPLTRSNPIHHGLRAWANAVSRNFDAGKAHHGWVVWSLTVGLPSMGVLAVHWLLIELIGWPAAVVWHVLVLYLTLGFRQFSYHFTDIRDALDSGDEALARQLLADWQQVDASDLPRSEIVRHVIEYSVLAAHRHVFGVLTWYVLLAAVGLGPMGAVFYRMAEFTVRYWKPRHLSKPSLPSGTSSGTDLLIYQPVSDKLRTATASAWWLVDWLPARFTALGFAVVGNFEDAIDCWRNYAQQLPALDNANDGVILAATSGAVNVRLGGETLQPTPASATPSASSSGDSEPEFPDTVSTPGREPELAHLRSVVGLVWRCVVLWMLLLALLTLSKLLG